MIKSELVETVKQRIRVTTREADEEVEALIDAAIGQLKIAGVSEALEDSTYIQAIVLYCKGNYGYDENTERFHRAFESLRDAMALSGDYEHEKSEADLGGNKEE